MWIISLYCDTCPAWYSGKANDGKANVLAAAIPLGWKALPFSKHLCPECAKANEQAKVTEQT